MASACLGSGTQTVVTPPLPLPLLNLTPGFLMDSVAAVPLHTRAPHSRGAGWTLQTVVLLLGHGLGWTPGRRRRRSDVSPGRSLGASIWAEVHLDRHRRRYVPWHPSEQTEPFPPQTHTHTHTFTCICLPMCLHSWPHKWGIVCVLFKGIYLCLMWPLNGFLQELSLGCMWTHLSLSPIAVLGCKRSAVTPLTKCLCFYVKTCWESK